MKKLFNLSLNTLTLAVCLFAISATANDVKLRIHHFLSAKAPLHKSFLVPLAEKLAKASNNRIKVEIFNSMALGGRPGDLYDQAVDGAVDIVLTLPGYTAGRFNQTEVFELPFLMEDAITTSKAFWDLIQSDLQNSEYDEVKVLAGWVHGPGAIHSKQPINNLKDMQGKEARGPTRVITDYLKEIGASPVGMPLPKIPESLSKGVINTTLLPWEVTPSIKLSELVTYHTDFSSEKALYTASFILAMNRQAYAAMPNDLRAILDKLTGKSLSAEATKILLNADKFGRKLALKNGNTIKVLDSKEAKHWIEAAKPVYTRWIKRAKEKGFDGKQTLANVRSLMKANQ